MPATAATKAPPVVVFRRDPEVMEVIAKLVVVPFVAKRLAAVSAVEEA